MPERNIEHNKYGRGIVKQSRNKGFELEVLFNNGVKRWIRLDEINEIGQATPFISDSTSPRITSISRDSLKYRRMIEAFRLGIVPYDCVQDFTFGRETEAEKISEWLNCSNENTLLIVGNYGTGKTHLLQYTYANALKNGFAVASVEMDPEETPFHKPKRVYRKLIQNFRYRPMQGMNIEGFRSFLKRALNFGIFKDHIYFKCLIDKTSDESIWDWIEAQEAIAKPWDPYKMSYFALPGLYDYSTTANIYCYLISSLGWATTEALGCRGLVLIFDEAETVGMGYATYRVESGKNFLKALIRVANNDETLLSLFRRSGLEYTTMGAKGIRAKTPFLYRTPSNLKLLFAFTPINALSAIEELKSSRKILLEALGNKALIDVFEHICELYKETYNFTEKDLQNRYIFDRVTTESGRTRLFVKGSVEALDLFRLSRGKGLDGGLK